jgi:hypothetical protein
MILLIDTRKLTGFTDDIGSFPILPKGVLGEVRGFSHPSNRKHLKKTR